MEIINRNCFNPGGSAGGGGPFVPVSGGTMTGPLVLPGNPTAGNQAADKTYVDAGDAAAEAAAAAAQGTANAALPKTGGVMVGAIDQPIAPVASTDLTNKAYVDGAIAASAPIGPFSQVPGAAITQGYITMTIPGIGVVKLLYTT